MFLFRIVFSVFAGTSRIFSSNRAQDGASQFAPALARFSYLGNEIYIQDGFRVAHQRENQQADVLQDVLL